MSVRNSKNGASIIELAVGLAVILPVVLLLFDLGVVMMGVQINNSVCREAARVAAGGNPGDPSGLENRAEAVIKRTNSSATGMLSNYRLIKPITTSPSQSAINQQMNTLRGYGGPVSGTITVETEVDIRPFVVKYAYGGKDPLTFRARQTFPFTYMVPTTAVSGSP